MSSRKETEVVVNGVRIRVPLEEDCALATFNPPDEGVGGGGGLVRVPPLQDNCGGGDGGAKLVRSLDVGEGGQLTSTSTSHSPARPIIQIQVQISCWKKLQTGHLHLSRHSVWQVFQGAPCPHLGRIDASTLTETEEEQSEALEVQAEEAPSRDGSKEDFEIWKVGGCSYRCILCDRRFPHSVAFWSHVRRRHGLCQEDYRRKHLSYLVQEARTVCAICDAPILHDYGELLQHFERDHGVSLDSYFDDFVAGALEDDDHADICDESGVGLGKKKSVISCTPIVLEVSSSSSSREEAASLPDAENRGEEDREPVVDEGEEVQNEDVCVLSDGRQSQPNEAGQEREEEGGEGEEAARVRITSDKDPQVMGDVANGGCPAAQLESAPGSQAPRIVIETVSSAPDELRTEPPSRHQDKNGGRKRKKKIAFDPISPAAKKMKKENEELRMLRLLRYSEIDNLFKEPDPTCKVCQSPFSGDRLQAQQHLVDRHGLNIVQYINLFVRSSYSNGCLYLCLYCNKFDSTGRHTFKTHLKYVHGKLLSHHLRKFNFERVSSIIACHLCGAQLTHVPSSIGSHAKKHNMSRRDFLEGLKRHLIAGKDSGADEAQDTVSRSLNSEKKHRLNIFRNMKKNLPRIILERLEASGEGRAMKEDEGHSKGSRSHQSRACSGTGNGRNGTNANENS